MDAASTTRRRDSPMNAQRRYKDQREAIRVAEASGDVDAIKKARAGISRRSGGLRAWDVIKWIGILLFTTLAVYRMFNEAWPSQLSLNRVKDVANSYLPPQPDRIFTEAELARYDGSDPDGPVYLALDGDVYDVTAGRRTYGPGGSYRHFAGVDAARGFVTGCFALHRTHDLRGLPEESARKTVDGWKKFYSNHKSACNVDSCRRLTHSEYRRIGRVLHEPIDPSSPLPVDCKDGVQQPS